MATTYATGKSRLIEPQHAAFQDTWDVPCNSNFAVIDALVSGITTIDASTVSSASPSKTLVFDVFPASIPPVVDPLANPLCGQNLCIRIINNLVVNMTLFIPQGIKGFWFIDNQTTGDFTVTVKTNAALSSGSKIPQGASLIVYCDGINVNSADSGIVDTSLLVPTGSIQAFAGTAVPNYWLSCNGAAVSRTTYAKLFAVIGTAWGNGDGSTTFNVPDLQNMFLRGAGSSPVGTYESDDFKSHTHAVSDPGHAHFLPYAPDQHAGTGYARDTPKNTATSYTASATTGVSIQSTGGSETRPLNKRVLYIIKT